jgi:hypothetical protein
VRTDRELRDDWDDALGDAVAMVERNLRDLKAEHQEAMRDPNHWIWGEKAHRDEDARLLAEEQDAIEGDEEGRWAHRMREGAKRPAVHWRETRLGLDTREFGT